MRNKRVATGAAITIAFFGYLWWSSVSAQRTECKVCVAYGGGRNCATASADSTKAAARSAHTTACGVLAHGMNDAIACQNTPALIEECKTR
jgi:hypothetical protein